MSSVGPSGVRRRPSCPGAHPSADDGVSPPAGAASRHCVGSARSRRRRGRNPQLAAQSVTVVELRVLDGPNLYFTKPAIKLTLGAVPWLALAEERAQRLTRRTGFRPVAAPGTPNSDQRRRYAARFAVHVARLLANATATRLALPGLPGPQAEEIVIAFVWRRQRAAEA